MAGMDGRRGAKKMSAAARPDVSTTGRLLAGAVFAAVVAPGCGVAAPTREPQAVLQPLLGEVNGLMGQLGGGRIVDGPRQVHCNMARNNDTTVRWQVFARTPFAPPIPAAIVKAIAARQGAGWTVDSKDAGPEKTSRLRKVGLYLTVTYLQTGRGDVVISGETDCFTRSGAR